MRVRERREIGGDAAMGVQYGEDPPRVRRRRPDLRLGYEPAGVGSPLPGMAAQVTTWNGAHSRVSDTADQWRAYCARLVINGSIDGRAEDS